MGALEEVTQMKNQGIAENKIINSLRNKGYSPKDIDNALNQSKIKSAVSSGNDNMNSPTQAIQTPSIVEAGSQANEELYAPQPAEYDPQPQYAPPPQEYAEPPMQEYSPEPQYEPQTQEYSPSSAQEGNYPQESYSPETYADYSSGGGTDTMIEVAETVFSQKTQKIQKQLEELNEFKTLMQTKVELFSERLKRIETIIDKLEVSILEKIGSYGSNLQSIKKEMSMMQDSFGKIVNKAVKGHSETTHKKSSKK